MNEPLSEYARVGLIHHMLYPAMTTDPQDHVRTLEAFLDRKDMQTFDCTLPWDPTLRQYIAPKVRVRAEQCGDVAFAIHLFPLRKISLATIDRQERDLVKLILKDQVQAAASIGATGFIFGSGADVAVEDRPKAREAMRDMSLWLCHQLKPLGITLLIEPFDRDFDKKFLYGPCEDCVELIESLKPEVDNFGIELDMAHVPLMNESFEHAVKTCAPHIKRVHIGNCVMKDKSDPFYGDRHPPIGYPGGEHDVPQVAEFLSLLLEVGYLNKKSPGALLAELQPFPGKTEDDSVADSLDRLNQAWSLAG